MNIACQRELILLCNVVYHNVLQIDEKFVVIKRNPRLRHWKNFFSVTIITKYIFHLILFVSSSWCLICFIVYRLFVQYVNCIDITFSSNFTSTVFLFYYTQMLIIT